MIALIFPFDSFNRFSIKSQSNFHSSAPTGLEGSELEEGGMKGI